MCKFIIGVSIIILQKSIGNVHSSKYYESKAKQTTYVQKDDIKVIKRRIRADVLFVIAIFFIEKIYTALSEIFYQKQLILLNKIFVLFLTLHNLVSDGTTCSCITVCKNII
jgi:hypothetical protein